MATLVEIVVGAILVVHLETLIAHGQLCDIYRHLEPDHSACAMAANDAMDTGVNDSEKTYIVAEHNRIRGSVIPSATNMRRLTWANDLAELAQRWAEKAPLTVQSGRVVPYTATPLQRYLYGRYTVGQSIAVLSVKSWPNAINTWLASGRNYTFGGNNTHQVASYTQLVWAETSKIGCGFARFATYHVYVCNYAPTGNLARFGGDSYDNPYVAGSVCGACTAHGRCVDGLCGCDGKVCLNQGIMDLNTCMCQCSHGLNYQGDTCNLDCRVVTEEPSCSLLYMYSDCRTDAYLTVPFACPNLCGTCPYAGVDFVG